MGSAPSKYVSSVAIPLPTDDELTPELVKSVKQTNDLNVGRMVAGTLDMAPGTAAMVQAVCQAKDIDPKLRELIILRSAYLLDCPYEWQANAVVAKNTGCTQSEIDAMTSDGSPDGLDEGTTLVIRATDELTRTGTLTDPTLEMLRETYDDVVCRKLVLIIAWFNLLSRFLNGYRVPLETMEKLGGRTSPLG